MPFSPTHLIPLNDIHLSYPLSFGPLAKKEEGKWRNPFLAHFYLQYWGGWRIEISRSDLSKASLVRPFPLMMPKKRRSLLLPFSSRVAAKLSNEWHPTFTNGFPDSTKSGQTQFTVNTFLHLKRNLQLFKSQIGEFLSPSATTTSSVGIPWHPPSCPPRPFFRPAVIRSCHGASAEAASPPSSLPCLPFLVL